ncbi:MAG: orotate phosphoribosyltransferase [Brevinema sp.]
MIDKKIAEILLQTKAVQLNVQEHFVFASGIKSPIYCDNRFLLGFPEERNTIIQAFLQQKFIQEAEVIAGTSTAGIAWAAIIANQLQKPMTYVRAEAKSHGASKTVEGASVYGKKTVIIEDLISTGGSSKKVWDNLIHENAEVTAIVAIFSYEFPESFTIFGKLPCIALSNFSTLIQTAQEFHLLSEEDCIIARQWNSSPHTWKI